MGVFPDPVIIIITIIINYAKPFHSEKVKKISHIVLF